MTREIFSTVMSAGDSIDGRNIQIGNLFATAIFTMPMSQSLAALEYGVVMLIGHYLIKRGSNAAVTISDIGQLLSVKGVTRSTSVIDALINKKILIQGSIEGEVILKPLLDVIRSCCNIDDHLKKVVTPKKRVEKEVSINGIYRISTDISDTSPMRIVIKLKSGDVAHISENYINAEQLKFPKLNVLEIYNRASAWCSADSARMKTRQGLNKFLTGWILRELEKQDMRMAVISTNNSRNGFGLGNFEITTSEINKRNAESESVLAQLSLMPDDVIATNDDFGLAGVKPRSLNNPILASSSNELQKVTLSERLRNQTQLRNRSMR